MAGGNRAYTIQDVLGQLNTDSAQGQADNGATLQINVLTAVPDVVVAADAVTLTAGATSFVWGDAAALWGAVPWQPVGGVDAFAVFAYGGTDSGSGDTVYLSLAYASGEANQATALAIVFGG